MWSSNHLLKFDLNQPPHRKVLHPLQGKHILKLFSFVLYISAIWCSLCVCVCRIFRFVIEYNSDGQSVGIRIPSGTDPEKSAVRSFIHYDVLSLSFFARVVFGFWIYIVHSFRYDVLSLSFVFLRIWFLNLYRSFFSICALFLSCSYVFGFFEFILICRLFRFCSLIDIDCIVCCCHVFRAILHVRKIRCLT